MKLISENFQRDVLVLMASRGVRAFAFSYLSVVFAIYLAQLGFSTVTVGLVFSTGYATSALLTAVWGTEARSQNVVEANVSSLRRKLHALGPPVIHTLHRAGYIFRPVRSSA